MSQPSAPPVRRPGTRSRAGNAMERTRAAALAGAARSIERHGTRRTTMADIAALGGVAKATLYNHFRRKDDVYAALAEAEIRRLREECVPLAATNLTAALELAADRLGEHRLVRRIAAEEPAVLAALVSVGQGGVWAVARHSVAEMLAAAGRDGSPATVDVVLRWLVTCLVSPPTEPSAHRGAELLAQGLALTGSRT